MKFTARYVCLVCHKYVPTRHDYSAFLCLVLIGIFGWFFGVGIIAAIAYYAYSPRICMNCKGSHIWKDDPKNYKKPTTICQNYDALENGDCSRYRAGSCYDIRSIKALDIVNRRGYICPHQDVIRESIRKKQEQQARWVKTFEQKPITPKQKLEQEPEKKPEQKKYFCTSCGVKITQKVKYCLYCGSKI